MTLHEELIELKSLFGTDSPKFEELAKKISSTYTSPEDKKEIERFMDELIYETQIEIDQLGENVIKLQLQEISEIISLSYLAKKYFGKTRSWIYQRINGNIVNGKPCKFTESELAILNNALKDISDKIGSLSISY
ncbi:MAG: DUF5053 domain-containing protein [Tannerella sp.]|nr:DUF5053 domain-containing protein [Tannerella sp.]